MGIKNLTAQIKKKWTTALTIMPMSKFRGYKIAIDTNNWLYKLWKAAHKDNVNNTDVILTIPDRQVTFKIWWDKIMAFTNELLEAGIRPVYVLDGKHPVEKAATKKSRADKNKDAAEKIAAIRAKLDQAKKDGSLELLSLDPTISLELKKYYKQESYPSYEDYRLFKEIMTAVGIPVLQAVGEAEQLCSSLALEGKVHAVFSNDADNLVYGTGLLLIDFDRTRHRNTETGRFERAFVCIVLDKLLKEIGLSGDEFVDLCIMAGCDYNENMPKVALGNSYKLIKQYHRIEALPDKYDTTILKYERCRELFSRQASESVWINESVKSLDESLEIDKSALEHARDILEVYSLDNWISQLVQSYARLPALQSSPPTERIVLKMKPGPGYKRPQTADEKISSLLKQQLSFLSS